MLNEAMLPTTGYAQFCSLCNVQSMFRTIHSAPKIVASNGAAFCSTVPRHRFRNLQREACVASSFTFMGHCRRSRESWLRSRRGLAEEVVISSCAVFIPMMRQVGVKGLIVLGVYLQCVGRTDMISGIQTGFGFFRAGGAVRCGQDIN